MTEQELKELIGIIKDKGLYCNVELEADETELSEDGLSFSSVVVYVYADEQKAKEVIKLQIILDRTDETFFLDNMSYQYTDGTTQKANNVVTYCKHLIKRYM